MIDTLQEKRVLDSGKGAGPEGAGLATRSMWAIGTTAVVAVTAPDLADQALAVLANDLRSIDEACSRFRSDSELRRAEQTSHGQPIAVSDLLFAALEVACVVAVQTAGIVDPTIGSALIELGYDRDFAELAGGEQQLEGASQPAPGWWHLVLDCEERTVAIPDGIHVDLGATAKAFVADRSAQRIASALGCGVLVNLGGDVAVAGPSPAGGWAIGIASECTTPLDEVDEVVTIFSGGLATSGTTARTWTRNGRTVHHIVDPWTGEPAPAVWSLVSITGPSCVEANAWSTAAVVWGDDAVGNLSALGVDARLVSAAGEITHLGCWPRPHRVGERPHREDEQPHRLIEKGDR